MRTSSIRKGSGCVAEFDLKAKSPLGGLDKSWGDTRLRELPELAVVAVSVPLGGEEAMTSALNKVYGPPR